MAYRPFDLTGKVALVTGGNGGIGFGMVEALAQAGADVVIWGSNGKKNTAAAEALKDSGVRVLTQVVDVADENAVREGMAEAVRQMGRIDTVVANAGIGGGASSFAEFPTETYRRVLAVNLDGVFFTFREACKHMVERANGGDKAGGSLVVISMIRSIAVEHARYGVRANAVLPGWIATDMTAGAQGNDKFNDAVIRRVPARRWGQPADFGGIAVYLSSDASAFHTGDSFLIDGGYGIF
jgi:NAD(P)-dependent dehydrogenase (short-subunit alcohol dehydrogenase family)